MVFADLCVSSRLWRYPAVVGASFLPGLGKGAPGDTHCDTIGTITCHRGALRTSRDTSWPLSGPSWPLSGGPLAPLGPALAPLRPSLGTSWGVFSSDSFFLLRSCWVLAPLGSFLVPLGPSHVSETAKSNLNSCGYSVFGELGSHWEGTNEPKLAIVV